MDVPAGVVLGVVLLDPEPPQPSATELARRTAASAICRCRQTGSRLRVNPKQRMPAKPAKARTILSCDLCECGPAGASSIAALTFVLIVSVAVAALPFGVRADGAMVQVAFCGAPAQASVTGWLNPPIGVIEMVDVTELPGATLPLAGASAMPKSTATGAVIVTATAGEVEAALPASPL